MYEKYQNDTKKMYHEYELSLRNLVWGLPIDEDFDEKFYYDIYPDVRNWYKQTDNKTLREKLFHHYFLYGKSENRSHSIEDYLHKNQKESKIIGDISTYINKSNLIKYDNKLECICLLVTGNELENGLYDSTIRQIYETIKDRNAYLNIEFYIITNHKYDITSYDNIFIQKMKTKFKDVKIISLDIPKDKDFYIVNTNDIIDINNILKYGSKSGPNFVFFETIKKLYKYNSTLFLECDCYLAPDWIDKISNFVANQQFLICGAQYDGYNNNQYFSLLNNHLNGGTSICATGNKVLQGFLEFCEHCISIYPKYYNHDLPYDCLINLILQKHFDMEDNKSNKEIITYIKKHYLPTSLIINYSTKNIDDLNKSLEEIKTQYNYAIIHKK
jgi:hypothetical protein